MRYDFYTRKRRWKPPGTTWCRRRLHRRVLSGLGIQSVCEIGIGFGEFAKYCRDEGILYVGVDVNTGLLNELAAQGYTVHEASVPPLPQIAEPFDAIFAAHVIEHMDGASGATGFVESCAEALERQGGRYLILLYPDIERCGAMFWYDYTHSFVTTKNRVEELLMDGGWDVIRSGRYLACFFATSGLLRILGWFIPYALLPLSAQTFAKLTFQQHAFTVAKLTKRASEVDV